jgi:branched-subunit amino acid ABC-type transport system permease component
MTLIWGGLTIAAVYSAATVGYNIVFIASSTFSFAHTQLPVGMFTGHRALAVLKWVSRCRARVRRRHRYQARGGQGVSLSRQYEA